MSLNDITVYCVVCGREVPGDRKKRRSITCSEFCAKSRNDYLRARKEARFCKYCHQPSSEAEREDFKAWKRDRNAQKRAAAKAAKEQRELSHSEVPMEKASLPEVSH